MPLLSSDGLYRWSPYRAIRIITIQMYWQDGNINFQNNVYLSIWHGHILSISRVKPHILLFPTCLGEEITCTEEKLSVRDNWKQRNPSTKTAMQATCWKLSNTPLWHQAFLHIIPWEEAHGLYRKTLTLESLEDVWRGVRSYGSRQASLSPSVLCQLERKLEA